MERNKAIEKLNGIGVLLRYMTIGYIVGAVIGAIVCIYWKVTAGY